MSRRDWVRYITFAVILLLALLWIAGNVMSVWSQYEVNRDRYRSYQQRGEKDQDKAAEKIANDCAVIPLVNPALRNCLKEQIASYQKKMTPTKI